MKYTKGMAITLDDNKEYIILRLKEIDGILFAYVQNTEDINDDAFVILKEKSLEVVSDVEKIKFLMENM